MKSKIIQTQKYKLALKKTNPSLSHKKTTLKVKGRLGKFSNNWGFSKTLQYGGDKPMITSLKYINMFDYENQAHNECNHLLNPIYGFLWSIYLLDNFILYTGYDIVGLMNLLFVNINGEIVPSNSKSIQSLNLNPENIGLLLGYCYLVKRKIINNLDEIDINEKKEPLSTLLQTLKDKFKSLGVKLNYSFTYEKDISGAKTLKKKQSEKPNIIDDNLFYMVMLTLLWWKCDNTSGIKAYYTGLNAILNAKKKGSAEQILPGFVPFQYPENPEPFTDEELTKENIIKSERNYNRKLEKYLAMTYKLVFPFKIISWGFVKDSVRAKGVNVEGIESIGDCIETTIRNLINILIYDDTTNTFSLETLRTLGATTDSSVYKFYAEYNTMDSHSYEEARLKWLINVVWNLDDVGYKYNNTKDGQPYKFELNCDYRSTSGSDKEAAINSSSEYNPMIHKDNIIRVLYQLFNNQITSWDDIVSKLPSVSIQNKLYIDNSLLAGAITLIKNKIIYNIDMKQCHYEINFDTTNYTSINIDILIPDFIYNDVDADISIFMETLYYQFRMFNYPPVKLSAVLNKYPTIDYFFLHVICDKKTFLYTYLLSNLEEINFGSLDVGNIEKLNKFLDFVDKKTAEYYINTKLPIQNSIRKIKSNLQKINK